MTGGGMAEDLHQHDSGNVLPREGESHSGDVFQVAVQMTRMAMVLSDPNQDDNPIVFCNAAFCEQTGYAESEVIGRNCRFLQGPATDPTTVKRIAEGLGKREIVSEEIYNYRHDGRGFWNALYVSPIFDPEGRLLYYFGSQVDVTRRKEAALQQQQRLDTVGVMASGVAHAFNNLMTIVVASIDQAAAQASSESQRLQLARADEAARDAGRLTQQMLSFARRQFLEEQTVDLNGLVGDLDKLVSRMVGERIKVGFELAAHPIPAHLDAGQLELALVALVHNAADAMPQGDISPSRRGNTGPGMRRKARPGGTGWSWSSPMKASACRRRWRSGRPNRSTRQRATARALGYRWFKASWSSPAGGCASRPGRARARPCG